MPEPLEPDAPAGAPWLTDGPVVGPVAEELARRIQRRGPIPFDEVMEVALYDPEHGFYASGGSAGRRGDFLTSPEVGPLFGAVLARALDAWWDELGRPDPFVVIESAAGSGLLARTILAAEPACLPCLTYVLVERSAALRARQSEYLSLSDPALALPPRREDEDELTPSSIGAGQADGPRVVALADLPIGPITGVILANELLDNLPVRLVSAAAAGWSELRAALSADGSTLVELAVPADDALAAAADRVAGDTPRTDVLPVQIAARDWVRAALGTIERGRLVVLDYADTTAGLAARPLAEWLRTYRAHQRGGPVLVDLGRQDITCEVALDQLPAGATISTQAEFLDAHGIEELVTEGRRIWHERAGIGDLAAMKARSRVREAEALLDPDGLGAFTVLEWPIP